MNIKDSIFELCDNRSCFIPTSMEEEFVAECNKLNIHPCGGIEYQANDLNNPLKDVASKNFHLDHPMSYEEGRVIADHFHLLGEYEYLIGEKGYTPVAALNEWDI